METNGLFSTKFFYFNPLVYFYILTLTKRRRYIAMNNKLEVGQFILSKYKYGNVAGVIVEVKKNTVVIKKCTPLYNNYTLTAELVNVTKSRIYQVGLTETQTLQGEK